MKSSVKNAMLWTGTGIAGITMLLLLPSALRAQSCALCYQSAAASGSHFIQALKDGILILLFPPIFINAGIAVMAYRKRNMCSPGWKAGDRTTPVELHGAD